MFDEVSPATVPPLEAARACLSALRGLGADGSEAELVDRIGVLEDVKAAAAAAQARAAERLDTVVRARQAAAGLPAAERGRGVAAQVALARRDSPFHGSRHLGLGLALVREMPHALAALQAGRLSEWRATLLVRETACLTRTDRSRVDRALCADPARLAGLGDREVANAARAAAYKADPAAAVARAARAAADRRVTLRPAPDVMTRLSAELPVADGVAAYAALTRAADAARAAGDPRSRGQLMADALLERITGRRPTDPVPIEVGLVITDRALLAGDHEPARIPGYGPIPAGTARALLRPAGDPARPSAQVWLRRLFTHPHTGELVGLDSRARCFPPGLRQLLVARDQICRTPWCDAPIRHADHITPHARGGRTSAEAGQGLCEGCNYTKQAPGFTARPAPGPHPDSHASLLTTPTGHSYLSRPPPQPGHQPAAGTGPPHSRIEIHVARTLAEYTAA